MQPTGYSPYKAPEAKRRFSFKIPKFSKPSGGVKKWLYILLGTLFGILFLIYLCLGELRFFANHFLRLGFFHKDYLIVFQNNYEARPTGGFITGYGEMSVTFGIPSDLTFHNSYDIETDDYVTPPYPHEELLKNEWYQGYTFHDANWNPSFPDSVTTMLDFYHQKYPEKDVDGIIVVNFSFIENLLDRLGGIKFEGEYLTKANLFKKLTDNVNDVDRHNVEALAERKDILGELVGPLMSKIKRHPFKVKSAVIEGLNDKDIFVWLANKNLEKKLERKGWANSLILPENSDYLAVNVANLGAKKADRYVIKEVRDQVNLKQEVPEITTEVTLRYPGEKNVYADDYKGYLRVYIPGSAEVLTEDENVKVEEEGDFKSLGQIIQLKAGENQTFTFKYQLPRSILKEDVYQLVLQKQSGDDKYYSVVMEGKNDQGLSSSMLEVRENKAFWQGHLKNDLTLTAQLLPDTSAPYPIEQVFDDLDTISIYWNEAISPSSGAQAENYEVVDLDKENPSTDKITVKTAEVIGGTVSKLHLEGVTDQNLEHYQVVLKGIKDVSNNAITPDPKTVTVVQRISK